VRRRRWQSLTPRRRNPRLCSTYCDLLPYCGDGDVQADLGEECDDANDVDDDACSNTCIASTCGDGVIQGDEECDDANDIDTYDCTNGCTYAFCGDGVVLEGKEECDDANLEADVDWCSQKNRVYCLATPTTAAE